MTLRLRNDWDEVLQYIQKPAKTAIHFDIARQNNERMHFFCFRFVRSPNEFLWISYAAMPWSRKLRRKRARSLDFFSLISFVVVSHFNRCTPTDTLTMIVSSVLRPNEIHKGKSLQYSILNKFVCFRLRCWIISIQCGGSGGPHRIAGLLGKAWSFRM